MFKKIKLIFAAERIRFKNEEFIRNDYVDVPNIKRLISFLHENKELDNIQPPSGYDQLSTWVKKSLLGEKAYEFNHCRDFKTLLFTHPEISKEKKTCTAIYYSTDLDSNEHNLSIDRLLGLRDRTFDLIFSKLEIIRESTTVKSSDVIYGKDRPSFDEIIAELNILAAIGDKAYMNRFNEMLLSKLGTLIEKAAQEKVIEPVVIESSAQLLNAAALNADLTSFTEHSN